MSHQRFDLTGLDDVQVLDGIMKLQHTSAEVTADLLCHLAEVDRRKLYVGRGCGSLFTYAVEVLGCTEDEAARRIHCARAGGRFPVVFEYVARGDLTVTGVSRLAPHLTEANHREVLAEAKGMTLRKLEELVARLAPKPDVAPRVVRVPERAAVRVQQGAVVTTAGAAPAPASTFALTASASGSVAVDGPSTSQPISRSERGRVEPLSAERWALRVTIGTAARKALRTAQDLLNPRQDEAAIVEQALIEYAERLEARKHAKLLRSRKPTQPKVSASPAAAPVTDSAEAAHAPSAASALATDTGLHVAKHVADDTAQPVAESPATNPSTRGLPASRRRRPGRAVMREVWERDGGRCTFVSPDGHRCSATARLEYHHVLAWALGGETTAEQLTLRCRQHNHHQAVLDFGAAHMQEAIARRRRGAHRRDPENDSPVRAAAHPDTSELQPPGAARCGRAHSGPAARRVQAAAQPR